MMNFCRFYHVTKTTFSIKKQGLKLSKMINPKAKKQWYPSQTYEADILPSVKSLAKTKHEPGKRANRRVAMLNKIFMKQVTDLMSTGTVAMDIVGRGIEISKVQLTPDFQTVKVFWVCKGNATDEETETVLKKTAGALRHELSTLRVMGEVPYITFVKDKNEAQVVELDRLLAIADYGDEYEPTEMGHLLKSEFTLSSRLSPEMQAKIRQLEDELPLEDEPLPEMTHDVYGLEHAKIMSRLLAARKKTRDAWVNMDADGPVISYRAPDIKPADDEMTNQRKELADFLLKRQILQNKLRKELRGRDDLQVQYKLEDDKPYHSDEENDDYFDDEEDEDEEQYYYYEGAKIADQSNRHDRLDYEEAKMADQSNRHDRLDYEEAKMADQSSRHDRLDYEEAKMADQSSRHDRLDYEEAKMADQSSRHDRLDYEGVKKANPSSRHDRLD